MARVGFNVKKLFDADASVLDEHVLGQSMYVMRK